jgi:hypothetical protein
MSFLSSRGLTSVFRPSHARSVCWRHAPSPSTCHTIKNAWTVSSRTCKFSLAHFSVWGFRHAFIPPTVHSLHNAGMSPPIHPTHCLNARCTHTRQGLASSHHRSIQLIASTPAARAHVRVWHLVLNRLGVFCVRRLCSQGTGTPTIRRLCACPRCCRRTLKRGVGYLRPHGRV